MTDPGREDFSSEALPADPGAVNLPAPPPPPRGEPVSVLPLPQPEDQDDPAHLDRAHLYGVPMFGTAGAGPLTATPSLVLGGVTIASAPDSSLTKQVVLDGLTVSWGRAEVMDQPSPATASFTLFDPTMTWAVGRDLIGQLVALNRTATKPNVGVLTNAFFLGRVTSAKVTRHSVRSPDGSIVHGTRIAFAASSLLNDLANRIPREDWPAETMEARRARIASYCTGVASPVIIRTYWGTPNVAPVATANQVSIYDHLQNLYSSCGADRWTWLPWSQQAIQLERRDYGGNGMGQLHWNVAGEGTGRDGLGAYIWGIARPPYENGLTMVPLYLDAAMIEFDPQDGISKDITSKITRVDLQYPELNNGYQNQTVTQLVPGVDESVSGVRTNSVQSLVAFNGFAVQASQDLATMAQKEGSGWKLDTFTIRTGLNGGGFDNWDQLTNLLLGAEVIGYWFIQRSWFAQMGIRPAFAICGGTIQYTGGEWRLDCHVAPVNTNPTPQHPISWSEVDDGSATYQLEWWDGDNPRGLHESVTYEDIVFVSRGVGMTTTPADQGWDFIV